MVPYDWKGAFSMSTVSRVSFCLLALSLSLIDSSLAKSQSSSSVPSPPQASAESAVRAVAEKYFALYTAEDLAGVMSLWSEKSPDYASLKKSLQQQFATEDFSFSDPVISRVKVESEKASLRAASNLTAINPKNNQKREARIARNFAFVREDGKWKVWRSAPAEEDLAEALVKARSEAERAELLSREKELMGVDLVRAVNNQGGRFQSRGEYPQALTIYNLAQSIAEQIDNRSEVARALRNIGHVHRSQGNFAQAMEHFQKSLALYKALDEQVGIALALNGIGLIQMAQGDYAQALEHYQKSLTIFETANNKDFMARVLDNIGSIHRQRGDYAQALKYHRKSLETHRESDNKIGILISLGNIGVVYSSQGNFAKALDYYQKSLAMSEAEDDKEGIAITLGNIGVIHRKQGNYAQALDYYGKSLAMSEAINDKVGISQMLNNIGTVHLQQASYAQALDYYGKSLAMREESKDRHGISHTMMAIGVIHNSQGNYAKALDYFKKSLAIKEEIRDRGGVANVLLHIGNYHRKQGDYSQALDFAEQAAIIAREVGNLFLLWRARVDAGLAYRALNQFDQARLAFEDSIAVIETMRSQIAGSEQEQQRFFEDKLSPYHAMVDLLVAEGNPTEALIFAGRAKSRALLDLLYGGRANIVKAMTSQEQEQERTLRAEIISLNTQVARANQQDKPDQARLSELKSLREKARLNYEAFQTSLYITHPELRVQRGEAPIIKSSELASLLPDASSALLEFVVSDDLTYLFTVTRSSLNPQPLVRVFPLPIKRSDLANLIEAFRQKLASRDLGFRSSALKLYNLLLKPAQAELRGKTRLVISPDDTIWDLPFQALVTGSNRFLIEESAISYAPSLTALREMMMRRDGQAAFAAPLTLLALGNPQIGGESERRAAVGLRGVGLGRLPEAEQEVKQLRVLYGASRSKVYVGEEAREERVKQEAGEARVLHFAAHGMLNNGSPMYSHLVLAKGGEEEDGMLEAWELTQMELRAELAVLSACETARGRVGAGEGVIGLTWAMFIAGVPTVVVSQWRVESGATREMMVEFHRVMMRGGRGGKGRKSKAEALREGAMKVMRRAETRHPFYWAGFVMIGDGR
jgi:CHAT domain-containing protein/Tfp pilus assembly protein PilF